MSVYQVTKTYGTEQGLSATFRQWRAKSHCRFMHGYALGIRVVFECSADELDECGWVYNFGGLKPFKQWLQNTFDHKTLVAKDDPMFQTFKDLAHPDAEWEVEPVIQLVVVERTGCEAFAKMAYDWLADYIADTVDGREVTLVSVEVFEHAGNSATYYGA